MVEAQFVITSQHPFVQLSAVHSVIMLGLTVLLAIASYFRPRPFFPSISPDGQTAVGKALSDQQPRVPLSRLQNRAAIWCCPLDQTGR